MITRILVPLAALSLLAGCSGSDQPPAAPDAPPPPATNQVNVATDPCTLLTDDEVSAHVGAKVSGVPDDLPTVGRGCRWEAPDGASYVSVILNTPAFPDVSSTARRTVDIGAKKGSVLADDGLYCLVYVNGGTPWLQFGSQSADTGKPVEKTYECDRSMPLVRKVVANLKW
ncbi:DUF3558 family protein [Kibdelosporangium phytohabitans]|uniref:DUF3558 domain-containing protein n=1 Tax=Kibdelosporangium phytohabitans TaxID=860235 RepID=A0A0N9HS98_9PSEU|nr:DUF3558 family protein [Kibdelosporangium phytohabitans]ALG10097.1 hypothetical protein AOZ06_27225 [Kibdelosporangium phytohabitans]MBE1461081.1 hypothetical protein [Kibdelosporangium phytohabitans]